jgi:hypothetical protein
MPLDLNKEATDLLARVEAMRTVRMPKLHGLDEIPQHFLVSTQGDPKMWVVHVKVWHICSLIMTSNTS